MQVLYGSIKIWDISTGVKLFDVPNAHSAPLRSVDYSYDGQMVATASEETTIKLWSSNVIHLATLDGHADTVETVTFSPTQNLLVSASHDTTLRIWDATSGTHLRTLSGHIGEVYSSVWSPDGQLIASGGGMPHGWSTDNTVRLWNSTTGEFIIELIDTMGADVEGLDFFPDGTKLIFSSDDGTIRLYELNRMAVSVERN